MAIVSRSYLITDAAYGRLITMAQQRRFVKYGSERVKGLSEFLTELSKVEFIDNRPIYVKEMHEQEIKFGRAPTWFRTRDRRPRRLTLTEDAIERYVMIALRAGIIKDEPYAVGGPQRLTPYPTVSNVLEVIGLQWLLPDSLPLGLTANESQPIY